MSFFGKTIQTDIFGDYHAPKIGVTVTGLPAGAHIDLDALQAFCDLRAPGQNAWSTPRREADRVIYTLAGPEIAVATTKAYSAQLIVTYLIAIQAAFVRKAITEEKYGMLIGELFTIPAKISSEPASL